MLTSARACGEKLSALTGSPLFGVALLGLLMEPIPLRTGFYAARVGRDAQRSGLAWWWSVQTSTGSQLTFRGSFQ